MAQHRCKQVTMDDITMPRWGIVPSRADIGYSGEDCGARQMVQLAPSCAELGSVVPRTTLPECPGLA